MKGSLRRKRRASEITDFEEKPIQNSRPSQTESDSLHSSDQRPVDEGQHASFADEFLNEYADIQYEDFESMISSLEYLNLNHMNFETN